MSAPQIGSRLDLIALVDQMVSQPELFDAGAVPIESDTVSAARAFSFSGRTTCNGKHEARALTIAALRLAGVSKREIAKQMSCSRNTIDAVMEVLETQGKIEPLKERLPRVLAAAATEAMEWAREIIADREVSSEAAATLRALGVMGGIGADKVREASVSVAGDLHIHQSVTVEGVDPAREWLRARAARLSTDSHAAGVVCNPLPINGESPVGAVVAACGAQPIDVPALVVDASGEAGDQASEGGGGGRDSRRPPTDQMANHSTTS